MKAIFKKMTIFFVSTMLLFCLALAGCSENDGAFSSSSRRERSAKQSSTDEIESSSYSSSNLPSQNNFSSSIKASSNQSTSNSSSSGSSSSVVEPNVEFIDSGINYTESTDVIENPGRGFYKPHSVELSRNSTQTLITTEEFNNYLDKNNSDNYSRETHNYAFIKIGLEAYSSNMAGGSDTDITQNSLTALRNTLNSLRASKLSATIRFTYDPHGNTYPSTGCTGDCEPKSIEQIMKHVEQVGAVVYDFKDCIYSIDAGFFGAWGEMHSTSYADLYTTGTKLAKAQDSLYRLIDKWLTVTHGEMNVSVRQPKHYVVWYNKKYGTNYDISEIQSIPEREGYGKMISLYNDAYLNSNDENGTDDGTYKNRTKEIAWLSARKFTSFGGESNSLKAYGQGAIACREAFQTHTAYLNYEYNQELIVENDSDTAWKQQNYGTGMDSSNIDNLYKNKTYFHYISTHLGYRLVLKKSELAKTVKVGKTLTLKGTVQNVGFGNMTVKKKVYIVIVGNGKTEYIPSDFDAQKTFVCGTNNYQISVTLPSTLTSGSYKAYMKIASPFDLMPSENKRQVRFANADANIFSETIGANLLGSFTIVNA